MHYNISVYKSLFVFHSAVMKKIKIMFFMTLFVLTYEISANEFSGEWKSQEDGLGLSLSISGSEIRIVFAGEGCPLNLEGTYKIKGKTLHYDMNDDTMCQRFTKADGSTKGECKIITLKDHLIYEKQLECPKMEGRFYKDVLKKGTVRKVDGIEIYTMGNQNAEIIDDAFIRSAPNTGAKPNSCTFEEYGIDKVKNVLPKKHQLTVIGRTMKKVKVQHWENYWYYVDAKTGWYSSCPRGWVFAEFISK